MGARRANASTICAPQPKVTASISGNLDLNEFIEKLNDDKTTLEIQTLHGIGFWSIRYSDKKKRSDLVDLEVTLDEKGGIASCKYNREEVDLSNYPKLEEKIKAALDKKPATE